MLKKFIFNSNEKKLEPKDFRVLLIYANTPMEPLMPMGVALLATALQSKGFSVRLFDTTFYNAGDKSNSQISRADSFQIKSVDYSQVGIKPIDRDPVEDFVEIVHDFKPHLIGLSCVELTYLQGLRLLESIRNLKIPNIVGGCFATFSPDEIISNPIIDMVCVGEGEGAIVQLSKKMFLRQPLVDIPNLWIKNGEKVMKPSSYELVDIQSLPAPRFNVFAPERIYRAMAGKIYRMLPIEFSRGCPYHCTYCSAPSYAKKFNKIGRWLRFKSIEQVINEIDFYIKEYRANYFYFISETFLSMPESQKNKFYKYYKKHKIPFWFNTRPETINEYDINCLEDIGCHRISIGIESGNEEFRKKMLKRNYSNDDVLKAVNIVLNSKILLSVNNMIGFPDETREMIFDTIELNRQFNADSHSVSIFQPFRGTELYDYCVSKGYWDPSKICTESFATPVLRMSTLTQEECKGLYCSFYLYVKLDKALWSQIRMVERMDDEGDRAFSELIKMVRL